MIDTVESRVELILDALIDTEDDQDLSSPPHSRQAEFGKSVSAC
jgi:hypothetical protein